MRLAIIDCGTNTFNLLIVNANDLKNCTKIFNTRVPVKLGEGAINKGFIADAPFKRGLEAMSDFAKFISEYKVEKTLVFATSAIRDASNGDEFVSECRKITGFELQVIDGEREAELIYLGNRAAVPMTDAVSLIMDIGGGSTEFILANAEEIFWKKSYNLGAARLLDMFNHSSPITKNEEQVMRSYLKDNLPDLFVQVKNFQPVELIGSSGAFDSVVEMIAAELGGEPVSENKTSYVIDLKAYNEISAIVKRSSLEERRKIKGLTAIRFDMIVISCVMIDFILEELNLNKMRVSTFSLKEGALIDYLNTQSDYGKNSGN